LWDLLDKLAERGEGCKGYAGFAPADDSPDEIRIRVDGDVANITYHPKLVPVMCDLCGDKCRERGLPPCDKVNPIRS